MAEHLALMAAHIKTIATRTGSEASAGASLMAARSHLDERAWRRWVESEVNIPLQRARELMDAAERAGASLDTLRPREIG